MQREPSEEHTHSGLAGVDCAHRVPHEQRGETVKLIYRQLVRKLHPDLQEGEKQQTIWQKKIWMRAQLAYQSKDLSKISSVSCCWCSCVRGSSMICV